MNIYRKIMPMALRKSIFDFYLNVKIKFFYLLSRFFHLKNGTKAYSWAFIGENGRTPYVFDESLAYSKINIEVLFDGNRGLSYVMYNDKKLYFPRNYTQLQVQDNYRGLLIEQDENSPHRYVDSYDQLDGKTLLDVGSAEGIFALEVIERVKRVYLFECENAWIEALEATFSPWKDKVEIVKKYVSNTDVEKCVTLDTFLKGKDLNNLFLKMDIEGAELQALHGASYVLDHAINLNFSICVYHCPDDIVTIPAFLKSHGYEYSFTKGYLFMGKWLRTGIVRCKNK